MYSFVGSPDHSAFSSFDFGLQNLVDFRLLDENILNKVKDICRNIEFYLTTDG